MARVDALGGRVGGRTLLAGRGALPLFGLSLGVGPNGIPRGKRPSGIGQRKFTQLTRRGDSDADPTLARTPVQICRCRLVYVELDPLGHATRIRQIVLGITLYVPEIGPPELAGDLGGYCDAFGPRVRWECCE
jgi:hypothetical protein